MKRIILIIACLLSFAGCANKYFKQKQVIIEIALDTHRPGEAQYIFYDAEAGFMRYIIAPIGRYQVGDTLTIK